MVGSAQAFIVAVVGTVLWLAAGALYHFSDTWQLVMNTVTSILAFLVVFLIQNTQNRDSLEIHLKLDELLRAIRGARSGLANLEELSDAELARLLEEFRRRRPAPLDRPGESS